METEKDPPLSPERVKKSFIHEGTRRSTKKNFYNVLNISIPFVSASCPFVDKRGFVQYFHTFGGMREVRPLYIYMERRSFVRG